jgi:4-amino-4-deoxy-L-arabinose transferase-like glycosyltransferase
VDVADFVDFGVIQRAIKRLTPSSAFLAKTLPALLLGVLLLVGLITVFLRAGQYGVAWDETVQDPYGRAALAWYTSLGRDTSFLTTSSPETYVPEHGVIFEVVVAAGQRMFSGANHWYVRHLITALAGLVGVGAIALCGFELGGYWVAFLAALGLWLYPRYYGGIYTNSKDVPAAVTLTLVLWAALRLIRRWEEQDHAQGHARRYLRDSLLLGALIGVAAAIRVNALIWYLILALFLAGWWLANGRRVWREGRARAELLKQGVAAVVIGVTSFALMIVLWPYVFLNPLVNLPHAVEVISHFPWDGLVLYNGMRIPATRLPATYIFTWLIIGSSLTFVALAALGLGVVGVTSARARRIDPKLALVLLSFAVPLIAMLALRSVVYDGLRQFLFLMPPLILVGAYGLARIVTALTRAERIALKGVAAGLILLAVVSYSLDVREMSALSPFEYAYFSPLIGGIAGAKGRYDTDYWATCSKQSAEWLASHYRRYTGAASPSVQAQPVQSLAAYYLPAAFREDDTHPDFYIASTRFGDETRYPSYTVAHVVTADGIPVCVIKVNHSLKT